LNARITGFELSDEWQQTTKHTTSRKRRRRSPAAKASTQPAPISGDVIRQARQDQKLSQRTLAEKMGKSQSWIRDVEKGRFNAGAEDLARLRQILTIDSP
jgi:ribosome-binding protein aMBF1 (putative translation factor)